MDNIFFRLVLGHLVGDFIFQNREMALRKSEKSLRGFLHCTVHSLVYSLSVWLFLGNYSSLIFLLVFLTHWPIDRYSLASKWLKMIGGRDFLKVYKEKEEHWEIHLPFSTYVYAKTDNTMHLFLLWLVVKFWF